MAKPFWKKPAVIIPAAVVVVGGAAFVGLRSGKSDAANNQATTNTQLYSVQRTTLQETVSASGTIEPSETDDLSFTSAGTVTAVNVKAGQSVKKGAVLASIDSAALQSALTEAQASLDSANAQLSDNETAGASAAQISSDKANVAAQQASVTAAFKNLAGANLTAPIDGTVSTVNLTVGDVLSSSGGSGTNISGTGTGSGLSPSTGSSGANGNGSSNNNSSSSQISVVSNAFVVNLSVDTATVGKIKVGQRATVTPTTSSGTTRGGGFDFPGGGGFTFNGGGGGTGRTTTGSGSNANTAVGAAATGKVTSVGTVASSSSGVATFPVVITIDGQPESFHAGASASAAIVYGEKTNVLAVPVNALTRTTDGSYVTVSNNGQTSKQAVTTGLTTGGQVEITEGLTEGQQVVITVPNFGRNRTGTGGNGGGGFTGGGGNFTPPAGFAP